MYEQDYSGPTGVNWWVEQQPYLLGQGAGDPPETIAVVLSPTVQLFYYKSFSGNIYYPQFSQKSKLVWNATNAEFVFTDWTGKQMIFFGLSGSNAGRLKAVLDAGGNRVNTAYNGTTHRLESLLRNDGTVGSPLYTGFTYTYHAGDSSAEGKLDTVTLKIKGTEVRRVRYQYYGASEAHGLQWDLKLVIVEEYDEAAWREITRTYYRYYTSHSSIGFSHGLKYVLGAEGYARMVAGGMPPETAGDSQVAQFADYYFEYTASRRVTKERVAGGTEEYSFEYYVNPSASHGANAWYRRTTETLIDGSQYIAYTNSSGLVIFRVYKAGSEEWYEGWELDAQGRVLSHAQSSAISGYSESEPRVGIYRLNDGLIHEYEYYPVDDPDGQPEGYIKEESVKKGTNGSPTLLKKYTYETRTGGDGTIYPIKTETLYQSETGDGAPSVTSYAYLWHGSTLQMERKETTLPVITTAQNGSNSAETRYEVYDQHGRVTWRRDERGYLTNYTIDSVTGAMTVQIDDVNSSTVSPPYGWTTPGGGGLNLTTNYTRDDLGRQIQVLGPSHQIDLNGVATTIRRAMWTVYKDWKHEVWTAQGYATGTETYTYTLVNPVTIEQMDKANRSIGTVVAVRASTSGKLQGSDSFPRTTWARWITSGYDNAGRQIWERQYINIPSSGEGSVGTNYYQSEMGYDTRGRQIRQVNNGGTITRSVLNPKGWVLEIWVGTNDTGATASDPSGGGTSGNNMKKVQSQQYDGNADGGDGNLTQVNDFAADADVRTTNYGYDYRNRQSWMDGEIDLYEAYTYDNSNRLVQTDRRNASSAGTLIGRTTQAYDNQGRVYETKQFAVNPSTGTQGNVLSSLTWYDASGNVIKTRGFSGRGFEKTTYNGMRWVTSAYVACNPGSDNYTQAGSVSEDWVLQQTDTTYDNAGNVTFTATAERNDNATGTGRLNGPSGSQPQARISYVVTYPDPLGRSVAVANYGTHGGTAPSRPTTVPASSDTVLVSLDAYNDKGELYQSTDPQGKVTRQAFNALAQVTETIENYRSGEIAADKNQTTEYGYNADGNMVTLTVQNAATGTQVTTWEYGTTLSNSGVASNALLRAKEFPDGGRIEYAYNRVAQATTETDPRGRVRSFDYDKLGRLLHDRVTTLGTGVDGSVRRISREYEVRGLTTKVTSWNNATVGSGSVVNEIVSEYNDFRQLKKEYQSLSGAKGGNTPFVEYAYVDGSANTIRRTGIIYPNGRSIGYVYGGMGTLVDRVSEITDSATSGGVATYMHRGINSTVQINYTQPGIVMSYIGTPGDGGDQYAGLDRFNRIIDIPWKKSSTDLARYQYGFSRASNRLWRKDVVGSSSGYDEAYAYDGLYQLSQRKRGTLSGSTIPGTPVAQEGFGYDPIGNWNAYETRASGTLQLDQSRLHNTANEITQIDGASTLLGYDAAGNMTKTPQPSNWSAGWTLTWDAWNRLMTVADTGGVKETYAYDGLSRRLLSILPSGFQRGYFYSDQWQVLEERTGTGSIGSTAVRQYIWGLRYIDDLILRDVLSTDSPAPTGRLYALHDQWHVVAITDNTGAVQERYSYSAAGMTQVLTPAYANRSASSFGWNITYGAYRWDAESGFYQVRYRYLQPKLGRWLSRDPIGEIGFELFRGRSANLLGGGLNLYAYVKNQATDKIDYTGLGDQWILGGKCCNNGTQDEWWLKDGVWSKYAPGECTDFWTDCDGTTCQGGFYEVGALQSFYCRPNVCKSPCLAVAPTKVIRNRDGTNDKRWTPTEKGFKAVPPGPIDATYQGPHRGAPNANPPPNYEWKPCKGKQ